MASEPGLSDYLAGEVQMQEIVKASSIGGMDVITAGKRPTNPSERLMHSRLDALIKLLLKTYDHVIIDAPPILAVSDAAGELGSPSDGPFTPIKRLFLESQVGPGVVIIDQGAEFGPRGQGGVFAFDERTGNPVELPSGVSGFPLWARSLLSQAGLALVLAVVGIRRLRSPQKDLKT